MTTPDQKPTLNYGRLGRRQLRLWLIVIVVALGTSTGCAQHSNNPQLNEQKAIQIAAEKGRTLGYKTDSMQVQAHRRDEIYEITFQPPSEILGGDVTIDVNAATGNVMSVRRGQ